MSAPRPSSDSRASQLSPLTVFLAITAGMICLACLGGAAWLALWQTGHWVGERGRDRKHNQSPPIPASIPTPILSGSMAPTLHGPAWQLLCGECDFQFLADANDISLNALDRACCPNCGNQTDVTTASSRSIAQRVRLRAVRSQSQLERGTIVAASDDGADRHIVKRIAGLPGESIAICDGDIYADGRLCKKSLRLASGASGASQASNSLPRVLVHDDANRSASGSRWKLRANTDPDEIAWLEYCHTPSLPKPFQRGRLSPIKDNYGFNQSVSRSLNAVRDAWVEFRWTPTRFETLHLEHRHGSQQVRCELEIASRQIVLEIEGDSRKFPFGLGNEPVDELHVLWGFLDGQICLVVNDHDLFSEPLDGDPLPDQLPKAAREFEGSERPFAIGFLHRQGQGELKPEEMIGREIHDLRIWRDVYYTRPNRSTSNPTSIWTSRLLEDDEYLLLGDNSPISVDARQGNSGYVKRDNIIGVVAE